MNKEYNLKLDLQFRCNNSKMIFDEFDKNTSDFFVQINRQGKEVDISNAIPTLLVLKPSGTAVSQILNVKDNLIYGNLENSLKNEVGTYIAKLMLVEGDKKTFISNISYEVTENALLGKIDNDILEDERYPVLVQLMERLSNIELQEQTRIDNENSRVEAEQNREQTFQNLQDEVKDLLDKGLDLSRLATKEELNELSEELEIHTHNEYATKEEIPTKISELENDKKYLTKIPSEYVTETELNQKGYLTEHQDISGKADKTELHNHTNKTVLDGITSAKITSWDNKSTFSGSYNDLTNKPTIPSIVGLASETYVNEYVENAIKDIPKEEIDLSGYATKDEVPTKVSQLTNDKGYLTEHQDISNKVDKVSGKGLSTNDYTTSEKNKLAGIETGANNVKVYTAKECTTFTSDDGTCTPLAVQKAVGLFPPKAHEHSQYLTEHQDISGLATKEYVDNAITDLNIDIDYDSLLAFDTNEIITITNYVDSDNNIILDDDLPAGTYTLKYEFEDGSYSDITSFRIKDEEDGIESLPEGTTYVLNSRWSGSTNTISGFNGSIAYKIPINIGENSSLKLTIANLPCAIETATMNKIYYIDRDGNLVVGHDTLSQDFRNINPSFVSFLNGGKTMELILTPQTNHEYIAVSFLASSASGTAITEDDMENFIISLEEIDRQQILTLPINSTFEYDARFNESSGTIVENGGVAVFHIPVTGDGNTTYDVNIEGLPNPTVKNSVNKIYYQNDDGSYIKPELSSAYFSSMNVNEITFADDRKSCNLKITPASSVTYIVLSLLISASNGSYMGATGKHVVNTVKISLLRGDEGSDEPIEIDVMKESEIYLN